jgi:hypothetical protein
MRHLIGTPLHIRIVRLPGIRRTFIFILGLTNLKMKETVMSDQYSGKRVPFITVVWPGADKSDSEPLSYDEVAEALLDHQMQIVWDEIEAAEAANRGTSNR